MKESHRDRPTTRIIGGTELEPPVYMNDLDVGGVKHVVERFVALDERPDVGYADADAAQKCLSFCIRTLRPAQPLCRRAASIVGRGAS